MFVLSIVIFGVTCELQDENEESFSVAIDHFGMTWQEAEAAGLIAPEENARAERPRRWLGYAPLAPLPDELPQRYRRWWQARRKGHKKQIAIDFTEFADLSDGRRVIVRSDRGFSWSWKHSPSAFHGHSTRESFADHIRDYFTGVEEDCPCCRFSPEWVLERLQRLYGLEINPASIQVARRVPLQVEFGPRLLEQLSQ